jgi:hypothetical protein
MGISAFFTGAIFFCFKDVLSSFRMEKLFKEELGG